MNPAVPVLVALAAAAPAPPPAGVPDGIASSRVERGALLALPSVYAVEAVAPPVPGRAPNARDGLAFAVRPDGLLVTALHVVTPPAPTSARAAVVTVTQLRPSPGAPARRWRARLVATDPDHDLALLRIPVRGIPALVPGPLASEGTPVAIFRSDRGAARVDTGMAGATQLYTRRLQREATRVGITVRFGESGGPAVDGDGRVRGVVVAFAARDAEATAGDGLLEPPESVDLLLTRAREHAEEGTAATRFRRGMEELWALEPARARSDLAAAREAFGAHTLAAREMQAADALESARFAIAARGDGREGLLAIGVASAVAAVCFAVALVALGRRRT